VLGPLTAALIAALQACSHAPVVAPTSAPQRDCNVSYSERFAFHSDPWINLHHFLNEWGRNVPDRPAGDRRRPVDVKERTELARLTECEQQIWSGAIAYYRERLVQRDSAFDRNLIALRGELGALACSTAPPPISNAELWTVLNEAMTVYRRHWWPAHHLSNAEWIGQQEKLLRSYEACSPTGSPPHTAESGRPSVSASMSVRIQTGPVRTRRTDRTS
jgi:hypothetical protein